MKLARRSRGIPPGNILKFVCSNWCILSQDIKPLVIKLTILKGIQQLDCVAEIKFTGCRTDQVEGMAAIYLAEKRLKLHVFTVVYLSSLIIPR